MSTPASETIRDDRLDAREDFDARCREEEHRSDDAGAAADDRYYIVATGSVMDERRRVLKHDEMFAVCDQYGDVKSHGLGEEGVYYEGTRFLSRFNLLLYGHRPLILSSTIKDDNVLLAVDLTNPDVHHRGGTAVAHGLLHVFRTRFLWRGAMYERLRIRNYGTEPLRVPLSIEYDADFVDIFEVRGTRRDRRGERGEPVEENGEVVLSYRGLDDVVRRTRLSFHPEPVQITPRRVDFEVSLPAHGEESVFVTVSCETGEQRPQRQSYETALAHSTSVFQAFQAETCAIETSNAQFNEWLHRSLADLHMMTTHTSDGPYPYAGVPWFSAPFGRDGIITALECLWVQPAMARGVLRFLAANQADAEDDVRDSAPGKILHEARHGEMAALREIPFGRYYGSVDSTPLFIALAAAYYQRTGDRETIEELWPHVERGLRWIETAGDPDGDGFVEYHRQAASGLVQQGWKDSNDSVFHADGTLAQGPIALCEVQGYVFQALHGAASLAETLGEAARAAELRTLAEAMRSRFEKTFWCEDLATYGLALDGQKRLCRVRSSNAGHCLFSGVVRPDRARRLAQTLMRPESFSGWGVRTLDADEARYNPMSYHNGSVWPHDNALIAAGLARYGQKTGALSILSGLFDASLFVDLHRMPELFCGFGRRPDEAPTLYPVACAPQSWAAAAVYLLLQAALGLEIDAPKARASFSYPVLPESLDWVRIKNLRVGDATLDLMLERHAHDVGVNVLRRQGQVEIVITK